MGIGTSVVLIAIGAILKFAVTTSVSGISIATVGVILMIAGAIGLVISLLLIASARDRTAVVEPVGRERYVERDRL
jgi:Na+/melibiose symporter-like transporter